MMWAFLSRLGGVNVMLPAAAGVAAWLCVARAWRMALWWSALFVSSLLLTVATKILFIGWGWGIHSLDFTGASGHAARAMAVIPVVAFLALQKAPRATRACGALAGIVLGIVIGVSRLKLHAHSISEVIAGCILGGVVSAVFVLVFEPLRAFAIDRAMVALGFLGLIGLTFARPAPTQRWMISSALYLSSHDRPYTRLGWKLAPADWRRHHPASATLVQPRGNQPAAQAGAAWAPPAP